jgi:hypothetical protein
VARTSPWKYRICYPSATPLIIRRTRSIIDPSNATYREHDHAHGDSRHRKQSNSLIRQLGNDHFAAVIPLQDMESSTDEVACETWHDCFAVWKGTEKETGVEYSRRGSSMRWVIDDEKSMMKGKRRLAGGRKEGKRGREWNGVWSRRRIEAQAVSVLTHDMSASP